MKSKPVSGIERHPKELTFAWQRGDDALLRFWFAVLLASGVFGLAWLGIRLQVPVTIQPDAPRAEPVELVFLDRSQVPELSLSRGGYTGVLVGELLAELELAQERENRIELYPAPALNAEVKWPTLEQKTLTLPSLPEISQESWPIAGHSLERKWELAFQDDELGALLADRTFSWEGAPPAERETLWSLSWNEEGRLVFAAPLDEIESEAAQKIRRLMQKSLSGLVEDGALSGTNRIYFREVEE